MMLDNEKAKKNDDKNTNPLRLFDGCDVLSLPLTIVMIADA